MARELTVRSLNGPPWGTHLLSTRSVNVADLLRRSIFTQEGRVSFSGSLLTMTRFVLGLDGLWAGRLRIDPQVFSWPDSLRKGFAEDLGLVMTTVMAEDFGWDGFGPQWADLDRQYWGTTNNRPDLIFHVGGGLQILGEAKGAVRRRGAVASPPSAEQADWLAELQVWGDEFDCKWFLSATWATENEVVVDCFDPGEPAFLVPLELQDVAIRTRESLIRNSAPPLGLLSSGQRQQLRGGWSSLPSSSSDGESTSLFLGVVDTPFNDPIDRVDEGVQLSARGHLVVILARNAAVGESTELADAWKHIDGEQFERGNVAVIERASIGVHADGVLMDDDTFEVLQGSTARAAPLSSFRPHSQKLRAALLRSGTLEAAGRNVLRFSRSHLFSSPTAAAEQILGTAANGWTVWKLTDTGEELGTLR